MVGSAGLKALRLSRISIRRWISGQVDGLKFLRKPDGMERLAASSSILLKVLTAEYMDEGGERLRNFPSVMEVKEGQSARLKLV